MANYKKMYCRMLDASEKARKMLEQAQLEIIHAQLECEVLYITGKEPVLRMLPQAEKQKDGQQAVFLYL